MKIVLDNNVFISGIFWQGSPNEIIKLAEQKKLIIVATSEIINELFGVLEREKFSRFFRESQTEKQEVCGKILALVELCQPKEKLEVIKTDSSDNMFLSCALASNAKFIVSGDKHLLALKKFRNISILTPAQFLNCFRKG